MAVSRMLVPLIFLLLAGLPLRAETLFCEILPEESLYQLELRLSSRAVTRGETLEVVVLGRDQNGKIMMTDHEVQLVVNETVIPLSLREGLGMTKISTDGLPAGTFEVFARVGSVVSRQDELDVLVMPRRSTHRPRYAVADAARIRSERDRHAAGWRLPRRLGLQDVLGRS